MSMLRSLQSLPRTLTLFAAKDDQKAHSLLKILQDSRLSTDSDKQSNYEIDFVKNQYPTWEQLQLITSFTRTTPNGGSIYRTVFPEFANGLPPHKKYRDEFTTKEFTGNSSWFKTPLVVDWEGQKFANDKTTLQTLIKSALAKSYF